MKPIFLITSASTLLLGSGQSIHAQERGYTWEGELEIGIDSTFDADDPGAELTDTYLSLELAFEAALSDRLTAFGGLTLESVLDATDDRTFDDIGLYFGELGLRYSFGETQISLGKISPVFAVAWDAAPGFYGTSLAEDYELSEMIGVAGETPLGTGMVSFAVFYADDTGLSDSVGTKRGRTSLSDGGVGNTGELNNVALQYAQDFGDTTAWVGARHLSAGEGDVSDETGVVAGLRHDFGNGFDAIGEVAHFHGAGGTDERATYVTVGAAYGLDDWTFSAAATVIDNSGAATDSLITFGVDRAITDTFEISFGIARFEVGGEQSSAVGLSGILTF